MSDHDRKEDEVRRLLDAPPRGQVPPDLLPRVLDRGTRALHRARVLRRLLWVLLAAAAIAFTVWASAAEPWRPPPAGVTPPFQGW
jgi:ferric-dicitrate binding protein FerR (iron transport regulator)